MAFRILSARLQQVHPVWVPGVPRPSPAHRAPTPAPPSPPTRPAPTLAPPLVPVPPPSQPRPRRKHSRAPGPAAHRGPALWAALHRSPAVGRLSPHGSRGARAGGAGSGAQVGAEAARGVPGTRPGLDLSRSLLRGGRALVLGEERGMRDGGVEGDGGGEEEREGRRAEDGLRGEPRGVG